MRAVIIDRPGDVRVGTVPDPTPAAHELIIRVGACGICGTDLHIAEGEFPPTPYPIVPGHEFAGEVVAMGTDIPQGIGRKDTTLRVGSRVAIDPSLYCGHCDFCRTGHGNLCLNWGAIGDTVDGAFAEYVKVPAVNAYVLPEEMSFRAGALIEPTACAVHGLHKLNPKSGDTFLITGAGTMGLLLLQLALRGGASRVVMVDLNTQRLQRATKFGAQRTYTDVMQALEEEPLGFDCVVDATGVARAIEAALTAVKRGGKFMVFGVAPQEAQVPISPFRVYNDEITIVGSMAILFSFEQGMDVIRNKIIDAEAMLTTALPLDDFSKALDMVRRGEGIKTQILPNG